MSIRVNPNVLPDLLAAIQQGEQNQNTATLQLSSGRRVNQLSDDPVSASSLLRNHDQSGQDGQFLQNISTLQSKFQVADSTLSDVVTVLTRAISLGTEGANGTLGASDRQAIAGEVQGLISQTLGLANTTYQGAFLFSGTAVTTQPFSASGSTVSYNGNNNSTSVQLSNGNFIAGNLPGVQLFQNGAGDVFAALESLNSALLANDATGVGTAVTQVQNALSAVNTQRVFYGNGLNQINLSENFLSQDKINLSTQENSLVGVDPAKAASDLIQAQIATQSVLSATGHTLSLPTLLDFLK
jgi:flagellar hook-associated protein 3 FlgL